MMNVNDIKTSSQFYEYADIWYQRTHNLREVCQNEELNTKRFIKAYKLWVICFNRTMYLFNKAMEIESKRYTNFKSGC